MQTYSQILVSNQMVIGNLYSADSPKHYLQCAIHIIKHCSSPEISYKQIDLNIL